MASNTVHSKTSNSSFIMQGMFLSLASIISRVIGLIYRVPLAAIIGKTGNDYYGTAFEIYNIILIISSYSLPLAISKMIAARVAENRIKDAKSVFKLGLVFALISGGIAFLIVFFGAGFFSGDILKTPNAKSALLALSPALIIVAVLGVLRGFFQGLGTMIPTAISQVIEQIVNAAVSIGAAYYLFNLGLKAGMEEAASYGAAGGTIGTVSGAVAAFLFMLFVHYAYSKTFKKKVLRDVSESTEAASKTVAILLMTIVPVLLSTTLYNISAIINQGIYKNIALIQGHSALSVSEHWGVFTGQYRVLVNIPISVASALCASVVPSLTASHRRRSGKEVRAKIKLGTRVIVLVAFPCMIGLFVLAGPLMMMLFNDADPVSYQMLMLGSFSVILFAVSTFQNGVLQGIDKMSKPVIHAGISLIFQALFLIAMMYIFDLHIYAVILADIFYSFMMLYLNTKSVKRYTRVKIPIRRYVIIPLLCSVLMGFVVYLVYYLIDHFTQKGVLATIVSILAGMLSYAVFILKLDGIREDELIAMPKGRMLVKIAKKMRLLHG